jgi:4-hydroxy-2-oxoheptanedioate aldolase
VVCGHPHVDAGNVERLLDMGFRWLMASPERTFKALELGRQKASAAVTH